MAVERGQKQRTVAEQIGGFGIGKGRLNTVYRHDLRALLEIVGQKFGKNQRAETVFAVGVPAALREQQVGMGKGFETADVVGMQVGNDDGADALGRDTGGFKPGGNGVFGADISGVDGAVNQVFPIKAVERSAVAGVVQDMAVNAVFD